MAQQLVVGTTLVTAPEVPSASPVDIFKALAVTYKLDPKTAEHFVSKLGLESLSDFRRLFVNPEKVDQIISQVKDLQYPDRESSRVRQAVEGVDAAYQQEEVTKKRASEIDDMDILLPQPDMDELRDAFWGRYKLVFPIEVEPGDSLVSRVAKEMRKRVMTVRSVWQTKAQNHHLQTERKRRKLADGLDILDAERPPDRPVQRTLTNYLLLLHTTLLAYAKAGSKRLPSAPRDEPSESRSRLMSS